MKNCILPGDWRDKMSKEIHFLVKQTIPTLAPYFSHVNDKERHYDDKLFYSLLPHFKYILIGYKRSVKVLLTKFWFSTSPQQASLLSSYSS